VNTAKRSGPDPGHATATMDPPNPAGRSPDKAWQHSLAEERHGNWHAGRRDVIQWRCTGSKTALTFGGKI